MRHITRSSVVVLLALGAALSLRPASNTVPPPSAPSETSFDLTDGGFIPAWLAAGPFEQPMVGFGQAVDQDMIGEAAVSPVSGMTERTSLVEGGHTSWKPLHMRPNGFVDFYALMGWVLPGDGPEKVWKAKAGYAFVHINSTQAQEAWLKLGANSSLKVLLNGETVHLNSQDRNAEPDTDSVPIRLRAGRNSLLVKVGQTHRNEAPQFFSELRHEWGFFARLTDSAGQPLQEVTVAVPTGDLATGMELVSTFFFREDSGGLQQRFDAVITSADPQWQSGWLQLTAAGVTYNALLDSIPFGESRHAIFLPSVDSAMAAQLKLRIADLSVLRDVKLRPQPRYEFHLALMSHTDIGYTNTQPVVKERHLRTLDDVLQRLDSDSTFSWTIETIWQLEQFEAAHPPTQFDRLMAHAQTGRIAISPIYTNPYTGWVSAEELIRSLDKGRAYARRFGLDLHAAAYNDTPGLSWLMPQVLKKADVSFLAVGINEVYNDYKLQRSLPKVFFWEGTGGGRVLTYITEAYNEGQTLGLEKNPDAVPYRVWERLHRLQAQGYPYELILALHTFGDNGGIPQRAAATAAAWNAAYAFPRIHMSNINTFADAFQARYRDLPTLTGDWTSTWEAMYQGEPARMVRYRWAQHQLAAAEIMATISWLLDPSGDPLGDLVSEAYSSLLHYSGHGSGLEYGYGSPEDNLTTMAYREQYVQKAKLVTKEALERAEYRLSAREESFEGEGLYLFNTLNWTRDAPVEAEFPRESTAQYRTIDLATRQVLPSHQAGHVLRFVARDIPPVGYKKIRLERMDRAEPVTGGFLHAEGCKIENAYYRIESDCATGHVKRLISLKNGRDLVDAEGSAVFGQPVRADSLFSLKFTAMVSDASQTYVRDERPARLTLVTERPDHLFAQSEFTLWENVDRVDIQHTLDLEQLEVPEQVEDYSVTFPFALADRRAAAEVLGGFLNTETDRFPGIDHDAFSLRRSVAIHNEHQSVSWAAVDSRVVRLRESLPGAGPTLIANLVNNFPEDWNRWEENEGRLDFRFSFKAHEGPFRPASTGRFGWQINTPLQVRYTWLRSEPASERFLTADSERAVLLSARPAGDQRGLELRLMNMDPHAPAVVRIHSDLLNMQSGVGQPLTVEDGFALVTLGPGAIASVGFARQSR